MRERVSTFLNRVTMRLQVLLLLCLQGFFGVRVVKSIKEVVGNLGGSVTLPSGADPTWTLSTIEWSIFKNNTWIATYRDGEQNIDRIDRYKGRLSLNTTTGDLTIRGLTMEDNMEFNVDFISTTEKDDSTKISLTVKKQLQQPTIKKVYSATMKDGCWIILNCSSTDEGVDFSWNVTPSRVTVINQTHVQDNSAVLFVSLDNTTRRADVTCTSSKNTRSNTSSSLLECDRVEPPPKQRCYDGSMFCVGLFVGVIPTILLCIFRGKLCYNKNIPDPNVPMA
ncbi:SLAM family member 9 isoform X2 [Halichoeres trimaculatus]|uniref:SLAM family member 9 isoform X2 n=1 Tax=Halichoeres trimaculatus TaxID=147232 RepID=UPI003D9E8791